eukprot:g2139.t1
MAQTGAVSAVSVHVDTSKLIWRTQPYYNSWNIDASPNRGFLHRNLTSANMLELARGLPGGVLRFGGSGNDALWYGDGIGDSTCAEAAARQFNCLNATMLDGLLALAEAASARLVFGLNLDNAYKRHWNGSTTWNSTNAEALIRHLAARGGGQPFAYELGNEDNGHWPDGGLSPTQEAQGFRRLADVLAEVYPAPATRPKIVGPDADYQDPIPAQALQYKAWAAQFLGNASRLGVPLHAATLHEYIEVGYNGSAWTSLDPAVLDRTAACAKDFRGTVLAAARRAGAPAPEVWAGEIGPHNGGSPPCDHSSMRWANFANSFWYADALAAKATHGFSVFCRQDYIGADYGLLDCATQTPLPDYWVGRAWTMLMGEGVLGVALDGPPTVRAYAHCAAGGGADVTVLLLNLGSLPAGVRVAVGAGAGAGSGADVTHRLTRTSTRSPGGGGLGGGGGGGARMEWHFTAGRGGLAGSAIRLGGRELEWAPGRPLPPMRGASAPRGAAVQLDPQSIAFVRLPGAAPAQLC